MLELLQRWLATAERLASRFPAVTVHLASWPAALLAGLAGLTLLVAGIRLGRVLAAGGAAAVGFLAGLALAPSFDLWNLPAETPAFAAAAVLGLLALASPELYPVLLGLVPGALLGARATVAGSAWIGAVAGGLALAALAVLLRRIILAGLAVLLAVAGTAFQVGVSRRAAPSSAFGARGGSTLRD